MREDLQIVCIPSRDRAFAGDAQRLADRIPSELDVDAARGWYEATLRRAHPHALVQEQAAVARVSATVRLWYVTAHDHPFRIDAGVRVPLPAEQAFSVYVDRVTEWQTAIALERIDTSPDLVGREYAATYHFLGLPYRGHVRTIAAWPPSEVAYEAEGSGISVWYIARFREEGGATTVRVRGDYALPGALLTRMADLMGLERAIARDIDRANESYRRLCEHVLGELADRGGAPAGEPASWTVAVDRLRAAQLRYRSALEETLDPAELGEAQEELLEARGEVDQLRRDLDAPAADPAPPP